MMIVSLFCWTSISSLPCRLRLPDDPNCFSCSLIMERYRIGAVPYSFKISAFVVVRSSTSAGLTMAISTAVL
jgi:hypothetical protein